MSQEELKGCALRDKLRELLLPAVLLTVVGSMWAVGYSRERAEDVDRPTPPLPMPRELLLAANHHAIHSPGPARVALDQ